MQLLSRRRVALFLIILGLLFLIVGAYFLIKLLWPNKPVTTIQQPRDVQVVERNAQPQTISLPTTIQGTSTAAQVSEQIVSGEQEALLRAEAVVSRMGSGTSQDGFLGFVDVQIDGTARFRNYAEQERASMQEEHPQTGPLFGITTRSLSSKLIEGKAGDAKLVVRIQSQRSEDAGDRSKPTATYYQESIVTLLKQADGSYLVDEVRSTNL